MFDGGERCEVETFGDGSWFCAKCDIAGDKDEDPEEYCKLKNVPPEPLDIIDF